MLSQLRFVPEHTSNGRGSGWLLFVHRHISMIRRYATLLLMLIPCLGCTASEVILPEDVVPQLRPLLEAAMRQSPRILERQLDLAGSRADGYVARSTSWPRAGGYLQYQGQQETRANVYNSTTKTYGDATSLNEKLYYNFSVTQPVWEWGALAAARRISRIEEDLAQLNYGEAYRSLAGEIRANYLALILAKLAVRNAHNARQRAEETLARDLVRLEEKQVTEGVVGASRMRVDETTLAAKRSQADLEYLIGNFCLLCGISDLAVADIPDQIADIPTEPALPESGAGDDGSVSVPIRAAELEVQKCKLGLVAPRFALFPKLALVAGVSRDEINRDLDAYKKYQTNTWYGGAQINWTIFDGFSAKGRRLAAYTRLRRAELRLANMRATSVRDRSREAQNVAFAWETYSLALRRYKGAIGGYSYTQQLADRGEASQTQVDAALDSMNMQQYAAQQALAAYLNTCVKYVSERGLDPMGKPAVQH